MSHIEEENFDLRIRSALRDAEEAVPDHVWETVSQRLDAAEAQPVRRPVIPLWARRAAVGLAAAAAVALGVFLFVPRHGHDADGLVAVASRDNVATRDNVAADSPAAAVSPSASGPVSPQSSLPGLATPEASQSLSSSTDHCAGAVSPETLSSSSATAAPAIQTGDVTEASTDGNGMQASGLGMTGALASSAGTEAFTAGHGTENSTVGDGTEDSRSSGETGATDAETIAEQIASMPDYLAEAADAGRDAADAAERETERRASAGRDEDSAAVSDSPVGASQWNDPLAMDGGDRARRKVRTAVTLSGDALSNGSSASTAQSGIHRQMSSSIAQQTTPGVSESSQSTYSIPASFGVGVKIIFTPRWSLGIGVNYSMLSRSFSGTYTSYNAETEIYSSVNYSKIRHNVNYIGIPVNAYFSIVKSRIVDFYAYAGGTAERAVTNKFTLENDGVYKEPIKGFQFSADLGIGVEFIIVDRLGIYIDPSLRYYFPSESQPKSIRTQEPFTLGFEVGLRVRL